MTFDDDFIRMLFDDGTDAYTTFKKLGVEWPPRQFLVMSEVVFRLILLRHHRRAARHDDPRLPRRRVSPGYGARNRAHSALGHRIDAMNYLIASLKHTHSHHAHISFWGPDYRGYVLVVADGHVGVYTAEFIAADGYHLNDHDCCLAVPEDAVKALLSPTPYYSCQGVAKPFYDTPGPVVDNTRANWNALIAAAMPRPAGSKKPKPEVFKGKRRDFSLPQPKDHE